MGRKGTLRAGDKVWAASSTLRKLKGKLLADAGQSVEGELLEHANGRQVRLFSLEMTSPSWRCPLALPLGAALCLTPCLTPACLLACLPVSVRVCGSAARFGLRFWAAAGFAAALGCGFGCGFGLWLWAVAGFAAANALPLCPHLVSWTPPPSCSSLSPPQSAALRCGTDT